HQCIDYCGRQEFQVLEHADTHLVAVDPLVVSYPSEMLREEVHQMLDLLVSSPDVLRREGEHSQDADADFEAPFEDLLEFVPAFHMSIEDVPEADLPSEPTVPIHDDRHVMRHGGQFDLMQEPAFVGLIGGITD